MEPLPALIRALLDPRRYPHPVERVELIETHISWVLLTGTRAYKLKKPVDLGFLDFSTLERRRHYCEEELRLNRRLAPQLYLAVLPIGGTAADPRLGGDGAPIEYAVEMVQFPQEARLDRVLARGALEPAHIDRLAAGLAGFHARAAVAGPDTPFGTPAAVYAPMRENLEQIGARVPAALHPQLERLARWSADAHARLAGTIAARKRDGFVRECHGDAHLANMALLAGEVVLFDCLEFNDNLRWIDVVSELAFAVMDFDDRGRTDFGRRLLNAYLEHSGDYAGLRLLRLYQVYRALVRAKVAAIRLGQAGDDAAAQARIEAEYRGYADLAERYTQPDRPAVLITHGLSGAGKTVAAGALVERLGVLRLRSDIERKRLHGLPALARTGSAPGAGLYTADATARTYERLAELAAEVLAAGLPVIVDATFLKQAQRARFRALAAERHVPFVILDAQAPEPVLRRRIVERAAGGRDASEAGFAVLERQLREREPLAAAERAAAVVIDTTQPFDPETLDARLVRQLERP